MNIVQCESFSPKWITVREGQLVVARDLMGTEISARRSRFKPLPDSFNALNFIPSFYNQIAQVV